MKIDSSATDWRLVEGEVVALDRRHNEYFALNPSGAALWTLLAEGASEDQLTHRLAEQFQLPEDQARQDVTAFLTTLADRGLLEQGAG